MHRISSFHRWENLWSLRQAKWIFSFAPKDIGLFLLEENEFLIQFDYRQFFPSALCGEDFLCQVTLQTACLCLLTTGSWKQALAPPNIHIEGFALCGCSSCCSVVSYMLPEFSFSVSSPTLIHKRGCGGEEHGENYLFSITSFLSSFQHPF